MEAFRLLEEGIAIGVDEENKVMVMLKSVYNTTPKTMIPSDYKIILLSDIPRALLANNPSIRRVKHDILVSGISTGHALITAGTLGWFVSDNRTGEIVQLSNAHVFHPRPTDNEPPVVKDILQPGPYDGGDLNDLSGYFIRHIPVKPFIDKSKCPVARVWSGIYNKLAEIFGANTRIIPIVKNTNKVDVAIATIKRKFDRKILLDDGSYTIPREIMGLLFAGSSVDNVMIYSKAENIEGLLDVTFFEKLGKHRVNDTVRFCGRTSGCQEGKIIATNTVINVMYGISVARFEDVVLVKIKVAGGDSGSLVFK